MLAINLRRDLMDARIAYREYHNAATRKSLAKMRTLLASGEIPVVAPTEKRCGRCGRTLPIDAFGSNRATRDGHQGYCRPCAREYSAEWTNENPRAQEMNRLSRERRMANPEYVERLRAYGREYSRATRDVCRNRDLKRDYGIDAQGYEVLLEKQGRKCAICGRQSIECKNARRLAVDHDHTTGAVRGLLCHRCNVGLGSFGDDTATVKRAAEYLAKNGGDNA